MKKEAYAESTIHAVAKRLRYLMKNCLLDQPEIVKGFIAEKNCSNALAIVFKTDDNGVYSQVASR